MNTIEKKNTLRVAPVLRAGRKLRGYTQAEMAKFLEISQSALSKSEAGILSPSSSMWFEFCNVVNIDASVSFMTGYIDTRKEVDSDSEYLIDNNFRTHKKYTHFPYTGIRALQLYKEYFISKLGQKKFDDFCESAHVDPDLFVVYDEQLNIQFTLDLLVQLSKKGHLSNSGIGQIAKLFSSPSIHGQIRKDYDQSDSSSELYKKLITSHNLYEKNHDYTIEEQNGKNITVSVRPREHLKEFQYKDNETLGSFFCDSRKLQFENFSGYIGKPISKVIEAGCFFKGSHKCTYKITTVA